MIRGAGMLVALAAHLLGPARRDWGLAMLAELDEADAAGRALRFACGCLFAAARDLPMRPDGRFALATHLLALGVVVPATAWLLCAAAAGHPFMAAGRRLMLSDGQVALAPALVILTLVLAAAGLGFAWFVTLRDWPRALAAAMAGAAVVAALVPLAMLLPLGGVAVAPPLAAILGAGAALGGLIRWHARLRDAPLRLGG